MQLYDYQIDAIERLQRGNILCGGVGSGKSRTAIGYFLKTCGIEYPYESAAEARRKPDLYIITTARKRDTKDWEGEMLPFGIEAAGFNVVIDSWNNITKYADITNAWFIFDEDRVVGKGKWAKTFIKIAKRNMWILLSATPGDTWMDYVPVFIANGFYRNRTEFNARHVVYSPYSKFPKIERYTDIGVLDKYRKKILVDMDFKRETKSIDIRESVEYDKNKYKTVWKNRVNPETHEPIQNISELCATMRMIVNSDPSRKIMIEDLCAQMPKVIIFYNFDYELEILRHATYLSKTVIAEWNGHKHEPIPKSDRWVYLVQYTAGAEGWNCIETNKIIFYSLNYSYKIMEQAKGRIDRLNTPFHDLYYFTLISYAPLDLGILRALRKKKNFNESAFVRKN